MYEMRDLKEFGALLAEESAMIIRQYFRVDNALEFKSDNSPVTVADKKAEEKMRQLIMKYFPEHGIIGEEFDDYQPAEDYVWVLDPIDGTLNYIAGGVIFGTLIALVHKSKPILGIIHQPILKEMLSGTSTSTTFNGNQVRVRNCKKSTDAVLLTTDPYSIKIHQNFARFETLRKQVKVYRGWGDCYGYLLLSTGCVDIMIDPIMNKWDKTALIPIIRGAGGTITDYQGNDPILGTSIVATGGCIHDQVIAILNTSEENNLKI